MLYSHDIENEKFNFFILFLSLLIHGDRKYKDVVDKVIKETHELAKGEKDIYTISRDNFPITTYLRKKDPDYFKNLDTPTASFSNEVYKKVYSFLKGHEVVSHSRD